jgi:hypothetical protein
MFLFVLWFQDNCIAMHHLICCIVTSEYIVALFNFLIRPISLFDFHIDANVYAAPVSVVCIMRP